MQNEKPIPSCSVVLNPVQSRRATVLLLLMVGLGAPAVAAVKTWDGSFSAYWNDAANWTGNVAPVYGDDLVFPAGSANLINTNNIESLLRLKSITFTGSGYVLRGLNTVTVTGIASQQAAGGNTLDFDLTLGADQTFNCVNAGASMTCNGNLGLLVNTLTVSGNGAFTINGAISGTGGVIKNGTGTLTFSGSSANNYSGVTLVNAGTLLLAKSAANVSVVGSALTIGDGSGSARSAVVRDSVTAQIGTTPAITINLDGWLDLNNITEAIGNSLTLNGNGDVTTGTGVLNLAANSTVTTSGSLNTIAGRLGVGSGTCTFAVSGQLEIGATVNGVANLVKSGSGLLYLTAANTFSGGVAVNDGILVITHSSALGTTAGGLTLTGDAFLTIHNDIHVGAEPLTNHSTVASGAVYCSAGSNSWAGTVVLGTDTVIDVHTNAVLNLLGVVSGNGGFTKIGPGTLMLSGGSHNIYSGPTVVNEGTLELNKSAGPVLAIQYGTLTVGDGLGGVNADVVRYTGSSSWQLLTSVPIIINNSGLLDLNNKSDDVGPITMTGGAIQTGTGVLFLAGNVTATAGGAGNPARIEGFMSLVTFSSYIFDMLAGPYSPALEISARIDGPGHLTKMGPSSLHLLAPNSYSGVTTVAAGQLIISDSAGLGATSSGTVVNSGAGLILDTGVNVGNESLSLAGSGGSSFGALWSGNGALASWAGPVTLLSDTIIGVVGPAGRLTLGGPISGNGGFRKVAAGTLVLAGPGDNTYTGDTTVNEGVLELGAPNVIRHGTLTIGDGWGGANADIVRETDDFAIWGGNIENRVVIKSSGLLDLNGHHDDVGPVELDGGDITNTPAGAFILFAPLTTYKSANTNGVSHIYGRFQLRQHSTLNISNDLFLEGEVGELAVDGYTLTKTGPSSLHLRGTNIYTGLTVVQDGWFWAESARALGTTNNGTVVSNGASLVLNGSFGVTNEALTLNGSGAWGGWGALDTATETSNTNFWTGPITLNGECIISSYRSAAELRISGAISGPGGVTKIGNGRLYFGRDPGWGNTYLGVTRVNEGTLLLDNSGSRPNGLNDLIVGDGVGGPDADVLRVLQAPPTHQDVAAIVNSSGLIDWSSAGVAVIGSVAGSGHVELGASQLRTGWNDQSTTFSGAISGVGGLLDKQGTGTFTLTSSNTYSRTYVGNGTLVVNGQQPASSVTVASAGTLGGTGTVGSISSPDGNVAPGASPGILTCSNLTFGGPADYYVELNGLTPGAGYDQLNVRGANNLASATLHVTAAFTTPVGVGDQFRIINNDASDAITGDFNGLPDGATFAAGGFGFRIDYDGGTGNDAVLTLVSAPAAPVAAAVSAGNGNHVIDPNECNHLDIVITNETGTPLTGIAAALSTTTSGAMINQPYSAYPNVPASGKATNTTPFQISTLPGFDCGNGIHLELTVATASHGTFTVPLDLPSGQPSAVPVRFDSTNVPLAIPDLGTVESTNIVGGFSGPLTKVVVSLWLTHTLDSDLSLSLVAPDGTTVDLSSANGAGANFGSACSPDSNRTTFDDAAATAITSGVPSFVGSFRPEDSLASLIGTPANGIWRLRIQDSFGGSLGTLRCWSLFLYPVACAPGGGYCDTCPGVLTGSITVGDPVQLGLLAQDRIVASCDSLKSARLSAAALHYDLYTFTNTSGADACVTVGLVGGCDVQAAAYLNSFDPVDLATNYLGDAGWSTGSGNGSTSFSVNVPAGARFLVAVNEVTPNAGCASYALLVGGLPCPQPVLTISPAGVPDNVRLHWPTWAGGYQLEAKPTVLPGGWSYLTNEPIVQAGRNNVTNRTVSPPNRFYRLHKP